MASTPSASALSAVLRCRGNIWPRNPPTKRPATSVYSLGLTGGSPAEHARSNQASAWEAFLQGDHVLVGRRLTVAYKSPRGDGEMLRGKDYREMNKVCHPKLSQSAGDARSAVHGVQHALVRQLARRLTSNMPGTYSQMIQKIKYQTHICHIIFVQETCELPVCVLKVSLTSPRLMEHSGQIPSFWSTLRSTCMSLTALVSEFMSLKLAVLWRSSSSPDDDDDDDDNDNDDALQHQNIRNNTLQANGRTRSPTDISSSMDYSGSGQMTPEDRPD